MTDEAKKKIHGIFSQVYYVHDSIDINVNIDITKPNNMRLILNPSMFTVLL